MRVIVGVVLLLAGVALLLAAVKGPMGKGFRVLLSITAVSICAAGVLAIASDDAPQSAESPAAITSESSERTARFLTYMDNNFGDGYGQQPVSWYGAIVDAQFDADGHLVIETSLSSADAEAVTSITAAVGFFEDPPTSLEIRGSDGSVLN